MDDPPVNDDESGLCVPVDISERLGVGCGDGVDGKVLPVATAACDSEAETSWPQHMLFLLQQQHAERLVRIFHGCSCQSVWMLDMSRDCRGLTDPHGLMGWVVAGTGTGSDAPTCQFSNEPKNSPNGSEMTEI